MQQIPDPQAEELWEEVGGGRWEVGRTVGRYICTWVCPRLVVGWLFECVTAVLFIWDRRAPTHLSPRIVSYRPNYLEFAVYAFYGPPLLFLQPLLLDTISHY